MDDEKNRLDDGTPAQMAGIQIKQQNKWLELTQNASRKIGQEKCLYFSVSDLLFPLVASILKSGKSSRITSLMRSSLGFLGRSTLNPPEPLLDPSALTTSTPETTGNLGTYFDRLILNRRRDRFVMFPQTCKVALNGVFDIY